MKPGDLANTLDKLLIDALTGYPDSYTGIATKQRELDAETICSRLPSVEDISLVIIGWYQLEGAGQKPLSEIIHAYYETRLKGEK